MKKVLKFISKLLVIHTRTLRAVTTPLVRFPLYISSLIISLGIAFCLMGESDPKHYDVALDFYNKDLKIKLECLGTPTPPP